MDTEEDTLGTQGVDLGVVVSSLDITTWPDLEVVLKKLGAEEVTVEINGYFVDWSNVVDM